MKSSALEAYFKNFSNSNFRALRHDLGAHHKKKKKESLGSVKVENVEDGNLILVDAWAFACIRTAAGLIYLDVSVVAYDCV